jgi:hypothetical protein
MAVTTLSNKAFLLDPKRLSLLFLPLPVLYRYYSMFTICCRVFVGLDYSTASFYRYSLPYSETVKCLRTVRCRILQFFQLWIICWTVIRDKKVNYTTIPFTYYSALFVGLDYSTASFYRYSLPYSETVKCLRTVPYDVVFKIFFSVMNNMLNGHMR